MKGGGGIRGMFGGMGKKFGGLQVTFLTYISIQAKNVCQNPLFHTTIQYIFKVIREQINK